MADRDQGTRRPGPRAVRARPALLTAGLGLGVVFALGCSPEPVSDDIRPDRCRNVLVVVVDALRGDRLGCTGRQLDVSPNLDALADDGVLFQQAIAQSSFTGCSVASLLTGLNPHHHGLYWGSLVSGNAVSSHVLAATHHTMAEHFADRGFRTAAWVQNRVLREELGFAQGFAVFEEVRGDKHLSSRRIVDRYLSWLAGVDNVTPTFAYLHVLDLHDPYDPRPPYDTMFVEPGASAPELETLDPEEWHAWARQVDRGERRVSAAELAWLSARYDGIVRSVDHQLGRLIDGLRALDRYETTAIAVTADHGDGFGEHGSVSHGNVPYIELVHVPLILKMPDGAYAGRTVKHLVRQIDLLPTLVGTPAEQAPPRHPPSTGAASCPSSRPTSTTIRDRQPAVKRCRRSCSAVSTSRSQCARKASPISSASASLRPCSIAARTRAS